VEEMAAAAWRRRRVGVEEGIGNNPSPEPFSLYIGGLAAWGG
jgi:hypothetical protein